MATRILMAKPGLDGHDRGAKLISRVLRDAGYEVIFLGIRQRADDIAHIAIQEDVDLIGLSILSGAHVALTRKVAASLEASGASDIPIVVGGTIPKADGPVLREAGAVAIFPTGTSTNDIIRLIEKVVADRNAAEVQNEDTNDAGQVSAV